MGLKQKLHRQKEKYKGTKMAPAFNALHTFLYLPNDITHGGTHVKGADDLKRTMNIVIMALVPCLLFGMFNAGYQHYAAIDETLRAAPWQNFFTWDNLIMGLWTILPLVIVSYGVGLAIEFLFAVIKGHEVEEGYLVTGMLVPLIVPVDIPLWMLAVAVAFGVVIGKEVFGGTGMNILNPALTIRAFLFFAYPTWMTGDKVWIHGAVARDKAIAAGENIDAISGETILGFYAKSGQELTVQAANGAEIATTYGERADALYSLQDMFWGFIPGSVGETSKALIIFGALFLIFTKIGSWRIIFSTLVGAVAMGLIFNGVAELGWISESSKFYGLMTVPYWQHLIIGSILFGAVYMATDPVTASQTNKGKWIYGFLIGFISIMIRVFNPAYPEGVFLAILLMNVFAPTIDHYVLQGNIKRRAKRLKLKTA
ncbi:MAG: NADH:ubiquinone reductase (Na(+)-transporting) subunit B [Bacteroidia bacterium]|nr:NADH:ubiquinone reductase (Na(+)-transporting) subunit B [Bacteroidia bacterium]NNF29916.1 NADH:ubiquinone reductase (Na(+)-transporting) subunit B [Flavobacteriaceae bacterium]MBT8275827.1 NADH:ubiquinone reductase (Na(+)-transporting) subunit B [Bacteroidia bacterium]NNJ83165.1 NADH:ubiquinone reductase (Na(+)-transporting) subunit B [Flavobacteriaceae bacterium]NNK53392.1 NADH:ubiquinone reductase (Na(+)-transporting) subunit B [Flavobacteriaceae bacterium]